MTERVLPEVDGVITADEIEESAASIAALQLPCGMIPWYPGGHCDPWNHVETAMALTVTGRLDEASLAYDWLLQMQRPDGSWHNYYIEDPASCSTGSTIVVEDAKLDTNVCAYIATACGTTGSSPRIGTSSSDVAGGRRAIDWVLSMQTERGEVVWAARSRSGRGVRAS